METLNYISVSESAERSVTASGARLAVRISGQSFFSGREAFKKAAEIAEMVTGLAACGITEDKIRIKNVTTQVDSGFLAKSSSATYDLEITCDSMDLLGPAVGAVASLKNSELMSMAWDYTDIEKTKREVLQEAVRLANSSAIAIASALGTSLAGLHRLKYEVSGLASRLGTKQFGSAGMRKAKATDMGFANVASGLSLSHTTKIVVEVVADFLVKTD